MSRTPGSWLINEGGYWIIKFKYKDENGLVSDRQFELSGARKDIAFRPWMGRLGSEADRTIRAEQAAALKQIYLDYYPPRHGYFRDRFNCERDHANLGLYLKRRKVKRI